MADWSGTPAYVQIADALRADIAKGRFAPGSQLPSYGELMNRYGVSVTVARSAIRELRSEGLVRTHQGKGVFVNDPLPRVRQNASEARMADEGGRVEALEADVSALKESLALVQAQLITLYEMTGNSYPEVARAGRHARAAEG
jgi:DNA-binding GntR family transcriptional regulator